MKAMILAAGRGERLKELTADRPKPLLEVGGKALIEHHLWALSRAGIDEIVINLSYRGDAIRERLGGGERYGVSIVYSDEGEPPLETGGGIVRALGILGEKPFLLVNSDVLTDLDYEAFSRSARGSTLVLVPNPQHHPRGDFGLDSAGFVTAVPPLLTYAGVAVLDSDLFAGLPPGRRQLKPILDAAIERRELRGFRHDGYWLDVGTRERLEAARAATQGGR